MVKRHNLIRVAFGLLLCLPAAQADNAAFDLAGPPIEIKVTRNGKTLPISQVPNLLEGDRIWMHPDLPRDQAAHYLLIAVFLRGSTNPPPEDWFFRDETWSKKTRDEGMVITVPKGAEQVVVFLAPETTGDFTTLRSAVRGRPGSFVRAVQELDQTSLDRSRLDTYLAAVQQASETDPNIVHDESVLLARSLGIRLEDDCFKKPVDQQAACLTQKGDSLVLNDGHSQSMVGTLTNGPASDLIGQLTYTPQAGSGYFSPYVGAIVDMGRILDSLRTAQYQYIPALGLPKDDKLELKVNNPPSFHNPKSVIVVALPAVTAATPPPLRPVDQNAKLCLQKDPLVLPAVGAPLVYSTQLAHGMFLHIERKTGGDLDLPAKADATRGGYVVDTSLLNGVAGPLQASLRGYWGFDPFTGPTFAFENAHPVTWTIPAAESASLVAGSAHTLHLQSDAAACVDQVSLGASSSASTKADWKVVKPDEVEVKLSANTAKAGALSLLVKQAGLKQPDEIALHVFAEAGQFQAFTLIPGDGRGTLHGTHLEEVASLELNGIHFTPAQNQDADDLQMTAQDPKATSALQPNAKLTAHVSLKDGRTLDVAVTVEHPRPQVALLGKDIQAGAASSSSSIQLTNDAELPQDGHITFSLKTQIPASFPSDEKIEIANADSSFHVTLGIADGGLILQDPQTILASFDPAKSFGNSAYGPLRFRAVDSHGIGGEWQPLAILVRIPLLKELSCPDDATQPCILAGTNLFLLNSVAADPQFTQPSVVAEGFVKSSLSVPHPTDGKLYIKLRDDPADVNTASLPITADPPTAPK